MRRFESPRADASGRAPQNRSEGAIGVRRVPGVAAALPHFVGLGEHAIHRDQSRKW
jgi:hypothetical protein